MSAALDVESLPGVGPTLAAAIRKRFTDADFMAAAQRMDLDAIRSIEGVSPKRAIDLVRVVRGDPDDGFLATPGARRVHEGIMERLISCAATKHGADRLRLLAPTRNATEAEQRIRHVLQQKARVATLDIPRIRELLRRIRPLIQPKPVCDTTLQVVAANEASHEALHGLGVGRWAYLASAREPAEGQLTILGYDEGGDVEADLEYPVSAGLPAFAPHALTAWLRSNSDTIAACRELATAMGTTSAADRLAPLPEPPAVADVAAAVEESRQWADAALEERLQGLSLSAADMMRALGTGGPPKQVQHIIDTVLAEAHRRLRASTGLSFRPFDGGMPLVVDNEEIDRVTDELQRAARIKRHEQLVVRARAIRSIQEPLAAEIAAWFEFDADFALGAFAHRFDLQAPKFGDQLEVRNSIHLDLAARPGVTRIHYRLGGTESLAVLTGANSGGKSTLLEHLCQVATMARMGLPVVGEATVPWLDEVHLVTATRGMDAGAFETFLRGFLPIADGQKRRLVLADEIESVTELEAAGRILAFFLDRLATSDSLAILVTHMAAPILANVRAPVRIDGIEATGLDAENQLIVDRCPKMGVLARSTPELIVQRLVATSKGRQQELFAALLERMNGPKNA